MEYLPLIGVAARAPPLVIMEEVTVMLILIVLEALPVVLITASGTFHRRGAIGPQVQIVVKVVLKHFGRNSILLYCRL